MSGEHRGWARDLTGAIALAEGAVAQRVFVAVDGVDLPAHNAFDEPLSVERGTDLISLVRRCAQAAAGGERVALVARAAELPTARGELAAIASRRLAMVVHVIADAVVPGGDRAPAPLVGLAPALALDDLSWGMLLAAGPADALDLALVARRATEDSGCPFFVVHEQPHAHDVEPVTAPSRALCDAFIGPGSHRSRRASAPADARGALAGDRAFAERVPFALGSAMRELESLTGRHHDVLERAPGGDAPVALVGAGALGDSLLGDIDRLRAAGHDVTAVRLVAWRPFPAARLVKALGRALAVTVLERVDQPLASGTPLAVQLKAAFSDALTWAPDYPGIGRIPRIVSGVVAPEREVDTADLDAIVHNVLADERGKRTFVLGGDEAHALWTPPTRRVAQDAFVMRGVSARRDVAVAAAELAATVVSSLLGVRTRAAVRELPVEEGNGVAFDLVASRARPRGTHPPHAVRVVALSDGGLLGHGNPLARLAPGGLLAVAADVASVSRPSPSSPITGKADVSSRMPPWARALLQERDVRVIDWPAGAPDGEAGASDATTWLAAAAFAGMALATAAADPSFAPDEHAGRNGVDGAAVARTVETALHDLGGAAAVLGPRAAHAARAAFDAVLAVR